MTISQKSPTGDVRENPPARPPYKLIMPAAAGLVLAAGVILGGAPVASATELTSTDRPALASGSGPYCNGEWPGACWWHRRTGSPGGGPAGSKPLAKLCNGDCPGFCPDPPTCKPANG